MTHRQKLGLAALFLVNSASAMASVLDFGVAGQFNAFIFENFTSSNSDVEGAVAVGGNMTVQNYSVNALNKPVDNFALVVGNNLNYTNGSVSHGNIYVGGTATTTSFGASGAIVNGSSPINFTQERTYLENLSASIKNLSPTGTVTYAFSGVQLFASNNTDPQIFNIDGDLYNTKNNISFNGFSAGQTIILNISGLSIKFNGGAGTNFSGYNTLFNLYDATTLDTGSSAYGSVLATKADVVGSYAAINGNVIAKSWNNNTQVNLNAFKSTNVDGLVVTPVPEPAQSAMMIAGLSALMLISRRRKA